MAMHPVFFLLNLILVACHALLLVLEWLGGGPPNRPPPSPAPIVIPAAQIEGAMVPRDSQVGRSATGKMAGLVDRRAGVARP